MAPRGSVAHWQATPWARDSGDPFDGEVVMASFSEGIRVPEALGPGTRWRARSRSTPRTMAMGVSKIVVCGFFDVDDGGKS